MTDPQLDPSALTLPEPPVIIPADELYDRIMGEIEPELVSNVLPTLKDRYVQETAEERMARAERYQHAFAEYEARLQEYAEDWNAQFRTFKRTALASLENAHRGDESGDLNALESSMQNL